MMESLQSWGWIILPVVLGFYIFARNGQRNNKLQDRAKRRFGERLRERKKEEG